MTRRVRSTLPFLRHWRRLAPPIRASRHLLIVLDFDGTLVHIAPRPDQVRIAPNILRMLKSLAKNPRVTLAVISGRRRVELRRHIGIRNIRYLGMYGWENGKKRMLPSSAMTALLRVRTNLLADLSGFPGVWIEHKDCGFSIHLLAAKPAVRRRIRRHVRLLLRAHRHALHPFENLRDIEIIPLCIQDKGAAVRILLADPACRDALPIYIGDDLSDEPAFAALRSGISVLAGKPRRTCARFHLRGPAGVVAALARLEEALK